VAVESHLALVGAVRPADIAGWPFVLAVVAIVSSFSLPFENGISRFAERQADSFALAASHNPPAMIELFEQFAVQNLSVVDAPAWEKFSSIPIPLLPSGLIWLKRGLKPLSMNSSLSSL